MNPSVQLANGPARSIAVVGGGQRLTFAELNRRATALAERLPASIGVESVVGLCLPPGPDLVVALLAILRRGAAVLPMDPDYPPRRLALMASGAGARYVFATVPVEGAQVLAVLPGLTGAAAADPVAVGPANLAYVVYTSGSTGTPRPVGVTHGGLRNLLDWTAAEYRLDPADRLLPVHAPAFDAAVRELLLPLAYGAGLVLGDGTERFHPDRLLDLVAAERVTLLDVVPSLLARLLDEPGAAERLSPVRIVTCGGEELPAPTARRLRALAPWIRLYNQYGPSEATIAATSWRYANETDRVPIGRPVDGVVASVLDAVQRPVPAGTPGELFIGGAGVARGYLGDPVRTAERFLPDPAGPPGARRYRTGDLVSAGPDGVLTFLGRQDDQVSINGYRIEPGEVTAALLRHPGVVDAAVVAVPAGAPRALAAYVVPAPDGDHRAVPAPGAVGARLRGWLAERLPVHLVPAHVVVVAELPRTGVGKLDRARLPEPPALAGRAPVTDAERRVAAVAGGVLGRPAVGADEDLFALGADSLSAARIVARVAADFGVPLPPQAAFAHRTVAALAAAATATPRRPLPTPPAAAAPAVSFAQRRLWFLDQLAPGNAAYTVCLAYRVIGPVDPGALTRALRAVTVRHECLRSRFTVQDGQPSLAFLEPEDVVPDLGVRQAGSVAGAQAAARAMATEPFDLANGPLLRAQLLGIAPADHLLVVTTHHAVFDGWSLGPFERDLSTAYREAATGSEPSLPAPPVRYRDFVAWQEQRLTGETVDDLLEYWTDRLAGVDLVVELPADRPHPPVPSYRADAVPVDIAAPVAARLRALARAAGATPFMVLLAVYQTFLARYTGRETFLVGFPSAGRARADFDDLVGFFVNTLPLRADLTGDPTFTELLYRVRDAAVGALGHQDLPFERLAERLAPDRELSRNPVVQVWFDLFDPPDRLDLAGAAVRWAPPGAVATRFDLELHLAAGAGGSLTGELVYAEDLFDRSTVERYARHLERLAAAVVADPTAPLSTVDLLDEPTRRQLSGWAGAAAEYRTDRTIPGRFEERVAATPDAVAVVAGRQRLSFAELNSRANQLAHHLRGRGAGPERVIALFLPPGVDAVVSLLAVVKAGAAYLPLDVDTPADRVAYQMETAGAVDLITRGHLAGRLPAVAFPVLDLDAEAVGDAPAHDPPPAGGLDNLLYVIYTSGSTGRPKGVAMTTRPLLNLVDWQLRRSGTGGPTLQFSALNFDISFQELFTTWLAGAPVVLLTADQRRDAEQMLSVMTVAGVRRLFCPPPVLEQLARAAAGVEALPPLAEIAAAGEQLQLTAEVRALLGRLSEAGPDGVRLDNQYGPTEAHVVTAGLLTGDPSEWPAFPLVGTPVANTRVYIVDGRMRPVPPLVTGELYVGGVCLARGYAGRSDLTAERFVPDPFSGEPGARLYRSGDLARWTADGAIELLGRADDQVKIRGYRIEPGEISAVLTGHPDVAAAAVVAVGQGVRRALAAYVVADGGRDLDPVALRGLLRAQLPAFMVPSSVTVLTALPLTAAGKLDRAALPDPVQERPEPADTGVLAAHERIVAEIWAEQLGVASVDPDADFFDLGGHSLLATTIVHELRAAFNVPLPVRVMFEHRTVRLLAAAVEAALMAQIAAMTDDEVAEAVAAGRTTEGAQP